MEAGSKDERRNSPEIKKRKIIIHIENNQSPFNFEIHSPKLHD